MSVRMVITGSDLDYFRNIVRQAISGNYGSVNEVRVVISNEGKLTLSTNGYTSEEMGRFVHDDKAPDSESAVIAT